MGLYRDGVTAPEAAAPDAPRGAHLAAVGALLTFAALLVALPVLARATGSRDLALVDSFYRAGALVFGSGPIPQPSRMHNTTGFGAGIGSLRSGSAGVLRAAVLRGNRHARRSAAFSRTRWRQSVKIPAANP